MSAQNLFLDTNIIIDYIVPSRRTEYACSYALIEKVKNGDFKAWAADYAMAETLGRLKESLEERRKISYIWKEVLTTYDVEQMVKIIDEFRKTPNFEVFRPDPISQRDIFDKVRSICVQATDALILLSVLNLKEKLSNVTLITRDNKFLIRARRLVPTAHPIHLVKSCPTNCTSKSICKHRR
jgi:predicted nucleic acid-binding protein